MHLKHFINSYMSMSNIFMVKPAVSNTGTDFRRDVHQANSHTTGPCLHIVNTIGWYD